MSDGKVTRDRKPKTATTPLSAPEGKKQISPVFAGDTNAIITDINKRQMPDLSNLNP